MMQWIDDPQSQYRCRLVCNGADIDELMEEHYLKFHGGTCNLDQPALDVERFIEEYLRKDRVEYEPDATGLPIGVLGATQFNLDGSRVINWTFAKWPQPGV